MIRKLVWDYPTHGFVIDREEARKIGLNVVDLDDKTTALCEELLATTEGCVGLLPEVKNETNPIPKDASNELEKKEEKAEREEKATPIPQEEVLQL